MTVKREMFPRRGRAGVTRLGLCEQKTDRTGGRVFYEPSLIPKRWRGHVKTRKIIFAETRGQHRLSQTKSTCSGGKGHDRERRGALEGGDLLCSGAARKNPRRW